MKNMIEIILDDEKIRREGKYNVRKFHDAVDDVFVNQAGLVKKGNFYVEYEPKNVMGNGMGCIMFLAGKQWFRENVREMRWYRDIHHYGPGYEYHVEDVRKELLDDWEEDRRRNGLPINR